MLGEIIFEHNRETSDYRAIWWLLITEHSIKHYTVMES